MEIEKIYLDYCDFIRGHLKEQTLSFKKSPIYRRILEHVDREYGIRCYEFVLKKFPNAKDLILNFYKLNDSIGDPIKEDISGMLTSPTNLRYCYHSNLILSYLDKLGITETNIVEIGPGYGGLCLAIDIFSKIYNVKIKKYYLIDLECASNLQKRYLNEFKLSFDAEFVISDTFGNNIGDKDLFLISAYCFSEISSKFQAEYVKNLFPKVRNGFFVWNSIPPYSVDNRIISVEPDTVSNQPIWYDNLFVHF